MKVDVAHLGISNEVGSENLTVTGKEQIYDENDSNDITVSKVLFKVRKYVQSNWAQIKIF